MARGNAKFLSFAIIVIALAISLGSPAQAASDRDTFLAGIWKDAAARGVSRDTFERAFDGYAPSPDVERQSKAQPEFLQSVAAYITKRVEPRIGPGRAKAQELAAVLRRIENRYGVPGDVVLAIWGIETNFGSFLGGTKVTHSLATLAQRGRRAAYFRQELLTALEILEQRHVDPENMVGSWAGAMGQTQFMPSSYARFAQDFDGDGRKDIWRSLPDALASSANYLKRNGWRPGETWGYEIVLPEKFDLRKASATDATTIAKWRAQGIRRAGGRDFPRPDDRATLYLPSGISGPAFLLLANFKAIKRYNNSNSYALAVGHLADRIGGAGDFVTPWPGEKALTLSQRIELQRRLAELSYDIDKADGVFDAKTREAIAAFQTHLGFPADGFPDERLMSVLGINS